MDLAVRPIHPSEWIPDRCLSFHEPLDPHRAVPQAGCPSLTTCCRRLVSDDKTSASHDRSRLEELYRRALAACGCAGFVAWEGGRIVAYNNFFPAEIAEEIEFYGWGIQKAPPYTLIQSEATGRSPLAERWSRRAEGRSMQASASP